MGFVIMMAMLLFLLPGLTTVLVAADSCNLVVVDVRHLSVVTRISCTSIGLSLSQSRMWDPGPGLCSFLSSASRTCYTKIKFSACNWTIYCFVKDPCGSALRGWGFRVHLPLLLCDQTFWKDFSSKNAWKHLGFDCQSAGFFFVETKSGHTCSFGRNPPSCSCPSPPANNCSTGVLRCCFSMHAKISRTFSSNEWSKKWKKKLIGFPHFLFLAFLFTFDQLCGGFCSMVSQTFPPPQLSPRFVFGSSKLFWGSYFSILFSTKVPTLPPNNILWYPPLGSDFNRKIMHPPLLFRATVPGYCQKKVVENQNSRK